MSRRAFAAAQAQAALQKCAPVLPAPTRPELIKRIAAHFAVAPNKELTASGVALQFGVDRPTAEECLGLCVQARLLERSIRGDAGNTVAMYRAGEKLRDLAAQMGLHS